MGANWTSKYPNADGTGAFTWTNADVWDPAWGCGGPEEANYTQLCEYSHATCIALHLFRISVYCIVYGQTGY